MKKKFLLVLGSAALTTCGVLGLCFAPKANLNAKVTKAAEKTFTFNQSVAQAQFSNSSTIVEKSVVTGVSSNLETKLSLTDSGGVERVKSFGDNGYFVRNGGTLTCPSFVFDIGVNNPTSISVTYGLVETESTEASEVRCKIYCYDGDTYLDGDAISGDAGINDDYTYTWTKKDSQVTPANKVEITVEAFGNGGNVFWGEPLYIKSVTLTWAC